MHFLTNEKRIRIFEALMLVFTLIFCVIFASASDVFKSYAIAISFVFVLSLSIIALGYRKDRHYLRGSASRLIIAVLLATLIIVFTLGLLLGFNRSYASLNLAKNLRGFVPALLLATVTEFLRHTLLRKNVVKTLDVVFFTTITVLANILLALKPTTIVDVETLFIFVCTVVLPIVATETLCTFLVRHIGLQPSLTYKLPIKLYAYILPIIPNLGSYLYAVVAIVLPFVIYLLVLKLESFDRNASVRIHRLNGSIITVPLILMLFIVVSLVSGIFKYQLIAIGSNSMQGTFSRGDAVMIEKTDAKTVKENDIIAFRKDGMIITHRVVAIHIADNSYEFITKGDANENIDSFTASGEDVIGIIRYRTKYIGFPTLWINELFNKEI